MRTAKLTLRIGRGLLGAAVILFGLASLASATVINMDIRVAGVTYSGTGAAPDSGTYWNPYTVAYNGTSPAGSISNLKASDGTTVTTVGFSVGRLFGSPNVVTPAPYTYLFGDWATIRSDISDDPAVFDISGLSAGSRYDLYLYSSPNAATGIDTAFTVTGVGPQTATGGNDTTLIQGVNYVLFSGLTPVGGHVTGSMTFGPAIDGIYQGAFNGFQLVELPIPEPSTVLLLGLGGWLLRWRRR